jgi:hypothetical protein
MKYSVPTYRLPYKYQSAKYVPENKSISSECHMKPNNALCVWQKAELNVKASGRYSVSYALNWHFNDRERL